MKTYHLQSNIGKAKYVVNFFNGVKRYLDGSLAQDIRIFSNKRKRDQFVKELEKDGYLERGYGIVL